MPRPNKPRSIGDEKNLARRIAAERQLRGLSYEGLAKLMTGAGCAIQGSAIFKIEKADPPRRITVNELVAFAQVFDTSVDNLLTPLEVLELNRAREILAEMDKADADWLEAIARSLALYAEFYVIAVSNPELADYVEGHRFHWDEEATLERARPLFDRRSESGTDAGPFMDAVSGLWSRIRIEGMAMAEARLRRAFPDFAESAETTAYSPSTQETPCP